MGCGEPSRCVRGGVVGSGELSRFVRGGVVWVVGLRILELIGNRKGDVPIGYS